MSESQDLRIGSRICGLVPREGRQRLLKVWAMVSTLLGAAGWDMGHKLRQRRQDPGLTKQALPPLAGDRLEAISDLENGHRYHAPHALQAQLCVMERTS